MRFGKFSIALILLITITSCSDEDSGPTNPILHYEASETFNFVYPVTAQTQLVLSAVAGSVIVVGVRNLDSIHIEGTRRIVSDVSQADADNRLSTLQVSALSQSDEFSVETVQPQDTEGRQYLVDFEIRMPTNMILDVVQIAGRLDIDSMSNSVSLRHTAGAVDLSEMSGDIAASVVAGSLYVSCEVQSGGSVDLVTVTGPISLTISTATSASFQANTVTGIINLHNLVLNNPVIRPDSVSGVLGAGDGTIELRTTTGNIDVTGI